MSVTMWVSVSCVCLALACSAAEGGEPTRKALVARSLVSPGDTARLERALARARGGERVVVGVIGGSITQGARASRPERRWGNRVAAWWRERFPKAAH